jgi:HSP20 family protein
MGTMVQNRRHPFDVLWEEFNHQVQDEFARLFNRAATWAVSATSGLPVSVWEDDNAVYAEADLPGVDPAKLEVTVTEGNRLTIQGERRAPEIEGASWLRQERPFGKFSREILLPALVDPDKVEAKYELGVLRLTLPKHEAARPRKIVVQC